MKIALVIHGFPPENLGGSEIYFHHLSRALSVHNRVAVFFRRNNPRDPEYSLTRKTQGPVELFALNRTYRDLSDFSNLHDHLRVDQAFSEFIQSWSPEVIHIGHLHHLSLGIIPQARANHLPLIFTLNDFWLFCPLGQLLTRGLKPCPGPGPRNCSSCLPDLLLLNPRSFQGQQLLAKFLPPQKTESAPARALISRIYLYLSRARIRLSPRAARKIQARGERIAKLLDLVDLFIAPSRFIQERFLDFGIPPAKIIHSDYGFDHEFFSNHSFRKDNCRDFGFVGSFIPSKGLHLLLQAFTSIRNPGIRLKIFGAFGEPPGYRWKIEKYLFDPRISLENSFPPENANRVYSQIDVLVVPSIWPENSPLVIHEAFLAGIPVIASRIGGIPELVREGKNGMLFDPGNPGDLREKMELLSHNHEFFSRLKPEPGQVKTIAENARELEDIYSRLIRKQSP